MSASRRWWTLLAVCLGEFMLMLDITIITVALPQIARQLHTSFGDVQWIVDAYALTLAAFLLNAGALADLLGRRRIFSIGLVLFTGASLLCGAAPSPLFLILARALQGTGGAILFATALALIAQEFTGSDRATALGIYGATLGGAIALGPLAGGLITGLVGWRWIFFLNVPIGVLALLITLTRVRETSDPDASGVDWPGCIAFSLALFALLAGLIHGNDWGWHSPRVLALLVTAAVLLAAFLIFELRQTRPMLDLSLFRKPAFAGVSLGAIAVSGSLFAMFVFLTLYFQSIQGATPLQTGLRFLPTTTLSFLVAAAAGRLTGRVSLRTLLAGGLLLTALGLWQMTQLTATSAWTALLPGLILAGIGFGIVNPTLAATTLSIVPAARSGMASGLNSTCRQLGIAIGIAALGAIFEHQIVQHARTVLTSLPHPPSHLASITHALATGQAQHLIGTAPPSLRPLLQRAAHTAAAGALDRVFAISALIALAGAILSAVLVRTRDFLAPATVAPPA